MFLDASTMNDHQEQQQQWSKGSWSLKGKVCTTMGRTGEITQALGGAEKIVSWILDIGQLEFDFAFDCDYALIFFPLEERRYFSESTVKRL